MHVSARRVVAAAAADLYTELQQLGRTRIELFKAGGTELFKAGVYLVV